jgi:hypothetical protein
MCPSRLSRGRSRFQWKPRPRRLSRRIRHVLRGSVSGLDPLHELGLTLQVPENELTEFLGPGAGETGRSVAPDMMTSDRVAALQRFTHMALPEAYAAMVEATPSTAIQPIYTVEVPSYSAARVCLLGDAGSLFPPFTASGVFKAITNAVELAEGISGPDPLGQALARWSASQVATAKAVSRTAALLEPAVIFGVPNLATMDPADVDD